ncbi:DUF4269 domain-containing protein [uncultured Pontibacter sp.]|uniref:DUF4269 domain-containing protein n=1 Tax=uncultured Pontibacter sp. TaxID=453356 RepID=UPI00262078B5|nr:DUF4269 domain-containing protein [uncultured Pontibacter sp.]
MREVKDFTNLDYLQHGNMRQQAAYWLLTRYEVMEKLAPFHPLLAGTIPLEIDIAQSDLDIVCCWADKSVFIETVNRQFDTFPSFVIKEKIVGKHLSVVANFRLGSFEIELFGQELPSQRQAAYRHMLIENRLLLQYGEAFRQKVVQLKRQGYKTEPAFAKLLGLKGDPYETLLLLEQEIFGL